MGREQFYGSGAWLLLTNINLPLLLFFRFHSSICFADVWTVAYKPIYHHVTTSAPRLELQQQTLADAAGSMITLSTIASRRTVSAPPSPRSQHHHQLHYVDLEHLHSHQQQQQQQQYQATGDSDFGSQLSVDSIAPNNNNCAIE